MAAKHRFFSYALVAALVVASLGWLLWGRPTASDDALVIYTTRQAFLLEPVVEAFRKRHDVDVTVVYSKKGLVERLKLEGRNSPADVIIAADASIMMPLQEAQLLSPLPHNIVALVAKSYRSGNHWVGVTKRMRVPIVRKGVTVSSYQDLASPVFAGRLCSRSGKHPYNVALVAAMIVKQGTQKTRQWLTAFKNNLARKPQGNDRAQARAIHDGVCDVAIMNSYYLGKMTKNTDINERNWADAIELVFPSVQDGGAYGSISAVALAASSYHREDSLAFIEFLLSDEGQKIFADDNHEYPIRPLVPPSELVASWGDVVEAETDYVTIYQYRDEALRLIDDIAFDQ